MTEPTGALPKFDDLPLEARRYLHRVVLQKVKADEATPIRPVVGEPLAPEVSGSDLHGLLCWLYRGSRRPDGTRVSWNIRGHEAYALLLEDLQAAK